MTRHLDPILSKRARRIDSHLVAIERHAADVREELAGVSGEPSADLPRPVIIRCLSSPDELIRVETLQAIARWKTDSFLDLVQGCLEDPSPLVRAYAVDSAAAIGGPQVFAILRRARRDEKDRRALLAHDNAEYLLIGGRRAFRRLVRTLCNMKVSHSIRYAAVNYLVSSVRREDAPTVLAQMQKAKSMETSALRKDYPKYERELVGRHDNLLAEPNTRNTQGTPEP